MLEVAVQCRAFDRARLDDFQTLKQVDHGLGRAGGLCLAQRDRLVERRRRDGFDLAGILASLRFESAETDTPIRDEPAPQGTGAEANDVAARTSVFARRGFSNGGGHTCAIGLCGVGDDAVTKRCDLERAFFGVGHAPYLESNTAQVSAQRRGWFCEVEDFAETSQLISE